MTSQTQRGTAVVTGASSGIGAIYADRLARRGYDLVLVARDQGRLDALSTRLTATTGRRVETLAADLTDPTALATVEALLRDRDDVTLLLNNAGVGAVTPLLQSNIAAMDAMLDLNVKALTRLTYAAAPGFVARGAGTIINIASSVALSIEVLNGVYSASKAYVLALTQSLQHELADKGVRVQAVLPGATATDFWNVAGLPHSNLPSGMVMDAEEMVDAALAGLDAGEVVTIPALEEGGDWDRYEGLRRDLSGRVSTSRAASRYRRPAA
jgi:short-subunit dehydrogenase